MIGVPNVRLIDQEGTQHGVIPTAQALQMARDAGLDLVEVAPQASPPVCRLLDYGKFKFDTEKRTKESRKKQKLLKMKEIRMQPKIETHDLDFKTKHIQEFLEEGSKVKVTIRFRGRELAHTEIGRAVLEAILDRLGTTIHLDRAPMMEGRFMSMIVSPKQKRERQERVGGQDA